MSSPKRERRSPDKRMPQLVSTRREYPEYHSSRGRGYQGYRPRRPYGGPRRPRGRTIYRAFSERYYPNRGRYESSRRYSRHSRSRSRGRSHSRSRGRSHSRSRSRSHSRPRHHSRSASPGRGHRSRSSSSRSSSSRSGRPPKHHSPGIPRSKGSDSKLVKLSHLRHEGSKSPDRGLPLKKKPRHAHSPSDDRRSPVRRRVGSEDRDRSPPVEISSQETITSNYADHRGDRSGHRSQDYRQASPQPSSSKKTVRDKGKQLIARNRLHDIFSLITRDKSFTLDEDISIAIQRNPYAEPSEESTVRKVFDEELFTMIRSHSEGQRQIFDREELKAFGHDSNLADDPDFERRVIRLKPGKSSQEFESSSSSVQRFRSTHKITRMIERDSGRSRSKSPPRRREQEVRLKLVPDPRYEARYADMQKKDGSSSRKLDPADLRHELRGSATTSAATSSSKSLGDLRSRLDKRDERPWLSMKDDSRDVKADSRRDTDAPDYSRRKDKYQYAEWMDKPEMIPKNPSYFEHDNRDELRDSRDRGRGRGRARGFRGRFMYRRPYRPFRGRGTFRGRGRGSSDRYSPPPHSSHSRSRYDDVKRLEGEWKHDKFAELEGDTKPHREDDQHPHSTSER